MPATQSTESKLPRIILTLLTLFSLGTAIANVYVFSARKPNVIEVDITQKEITKWQEIVKKYPTYRDAYLTLAKLYEQKGNYTKAAALIKTAHRLDPLNKEVNDFAAVLGVRSF